MQWKCFLGRRGFAGVVDILKARRLRIAAALACGCLSAVPVHGQIIPNSGKSLRSLPPIRAIPLKNGAVKTGIVPDALGSPPYCDSEALRENATLRSIRFWDDRSGIAVGDHGIVLVSQDGGTTWTTPQIKVSCRLNDAHWIDARRVIVVGGGYDVITGLSRGVILVSDDAGESWKRASDSDMPLLRSIASAPTPQRPATRQTRRPPTIVANAEADPITGAFQFQSHDAGKSWQAIIRSSQAAFPDTIAVEKATPPNSPELAPGFRASCQLNDGTVIRVGDHGVIQRRRDPGSPWETVRGQDASAALLVIASDPSKIPWSLLGREALEKRLRVNLLVGMIDPSRRGTLEQAAMHLGVTAVDTFTGPDELTTVQAWIESRRPKILAIDSGIETDTKTALMQHAVAFGCGKVVGYEPGVVGEMLLHDNAVMLGSGALAADFRDDAAEMALGCGTPIVDTRKPWIAIKTIFGSDAKGDSIASGVHLTRAHRLLSRSSKSSRRRSQVIQGRLKQQTRIAELFEEQRSTRKDRSEQFIAAFQLLLDQTSRIDQFRSAWLVARQSSGSGYEVPVWKEIHERFAHSSAGKLAELHAKAREKSREWKYLEMIAGDFDASLVRGVASDSTVIRAAPFATLPEAAKELLPGDQGHTSIVSPFQTAGDPGIQPPPDVVQASASMPIKRHEAQPALNPALGAGNHEVDLSWQMHPVRLIVEDALSNAEPIASSPREGDSIDHDGLAQHSEKKRSADVRRIADGQTPWSALLQKDSPQATVASITTHPPRLDGTLNESFWSTTDSQPATTRDGRTVRLQLAYDHEFLYVAVRSNAEDFAESPADGEVGRRDADLTDSDRVSIGFDIDQDLLTAMRVSFTRDGRTHDDLDGHLRWNPTWYVATKQHGDQVISEIAIELSTMGVEIQPGDSWFIETAITDAGQSRPLRWMPEPRTRIRVDFR